jgi:hypothetical protein
LFTGSRGIDLRVEGIDSPFSQVIGIIAGNTKVIEIPRGSGRLVLMVSRCRLGAAFIESPVGFIAFGVLCVSSTIVDIISGSKYGPRNAAE